MVAKLSLLLNTNQYEMYDAGEMIFREGQAGDVMYVVKDGEIEITVGGRTVEIVGPGGIIGEMALIDNEPRSATAIARTPCQIVPIDEDRFQFLVQQTPYFASQVLRVMAFRLRQMDALMD
jgi:CRP/FNR family cyclic AMP-dependent transcriptional regulator